MAVVWRYSTEFGSFGASYVKEIKDIPLPSCDRNGVQKISVAAVYDSWRYSQSILRVSPYKSHTKFVGERHPFKSDNLINTARYLANGAR